MPSIVRFCVQCNRDKQVDAISFRCLTCGTPTGTPADPSPSANGTQASAPATRLKLPRTHATRRWMQQTRALADGFATSAERAQRKAGEIQAESRRLGLVADAFRGLLGQLSLDDTVENPPAGSTPAEARAMGARARAVCQVWEHRASAQGPRVLHALLAAECGGGGMNRVRRAEFDGQYADLFVFRGATRPYQQAKPRPVPGYVSDEQYVGGPPHPEWWEPQNPWVHVLLFIALIAALIAVVIWSGAKP